MRIIAAVMVMAVALAHLLAAAAEIELASQLDRDWQEYREHVGDPAFSATSENLLDSLEIRLDTER